MVARGIVHLGTAGDDTLERGDFAMVGEGIFQERDD